LGDAEAEKWSDFWGIDEIFEDADGFWGEFADAVEDGVDLVIEGFLEIAFKDGAIVSPEVDCAGRDADGGSGLVDRHAVEDGEEDAVLLRR
jgi:hypothetical protein